MERNRVIGVERVVIGVRDDHIRTELTDLVGEPDQITALDLQRVVAEIETPEPGPERRRRALGLAMTNPLDVLDRLVGIAPQLPRLAPLAVRERDHVRRPPAAVATAMAPPARQTKSASCAPMTSKRLAAVAVTLRSSLAPRASLYSTDWS